MRQHPDRGKLRPPAASPEQDAMAAGRPYRLIAASDSEAIARRRDRAITLLLARPGLRPGDVTQLRLVDVELQTGSLRVCG